MTELVFDPQTYISLLTLTALEIVLGIDNILFISIVSSRLPKNLQEKARRLGLFFALFGRLGLLMSLSWVLSLTKPLFSLLGHNISGRDLVLGVGGLFLIYKATQEIFFHLEVKDEKNSEEQPQFMTMRSAIIQIVMLDIVFSLDSIITAIGLVSHVSIMAVAIVIAVIIMLFFSKIISKFLDRHPSMKVLGLAFLLLVGVLLVLECFGYAIPRGYIYFSLAFSLSVEVINIKHREYAQRKK
jgi:predicted tellurium resistance membrane protein TerC